MVQQQQPNIPLTSSLTSPLSGGLTGGGISPWSASTGISGATTGIAGGGGGPSGSGSPPAISPSDFNSKISESAIGPWHDETYFQYALANDIGYNSELFADQQLMLYESGQIPAGEEAAIELAQTTSLGALSGQLLSEGIDPSTSTAFSAGAATIATERSIQTQQALQQVLQNYFQSQGMALQADQLIGQFQEFEQELQLQYAQLAVQQQEFASSQKKQGIGQAAGAVGGLFGGKVVLLAAMSALYHVIGAV